MGLSDGMRNTGDSLYRNHGRILHLALIALAGMVVYSNTFHVQFVLDDYAGISFHGPRDYLETLLHGSPRRVADLTIAINYRLHGMQVAGYHLVNLAIHLSASITLYFLINSALAALRQSSPHHDSADAETDFVDRFIPLAVALLFTLHPVQTQAVTYIIQRYTSLATLFYLLAALLFIRARLAHERSGSCTQTLLLGGGTLVAGLLALGSKQIAATLPLMLIALEIFLFRGRLISRRFFMGCAALFIIASGILLLAWHERSFDAIIAALHEVTAEDRYIGRTTYFLTQTRVVATYLRLLCLPIGQSLFYDYPVYKTLLSLPVIASLALHISLITAAGFLLRRSGRNLGTDSHRQAELQRLAALGIAWFYVAMIVESSIFPITDRIFEHRIYLPSSGFFLTVAAGTAYAVHSRRAAWALLTAACLALGGLTVARNQIWSDSLLLWQDTARKAPNKDLALANLAGEYMKLNMPEKALPLFVRSLELNPDFHARTKVSLGKALQYLNTDVLRYSTGEELASYGTGEITRDDRNRLESILYNNLGLAYEYLGEPLKARESYRAALRIDPAYDRAWYNLGLLSIQTRDQQQAANALIQLKKLKPYLADQLAATMTQ